MSTEDGFHSRDVDKNLNFLVTFTAALSMKSHTSNCFQQRNVKTPNIDSALCLFMTAVLCWLGFGSKVFKVPTTDLKTSKKGLWSGNFCWIQLIVSQQNSFESFAIKIEVPDRETETEKRTRNRVQNFLHETLQDSWPEQRGFHSLLVIQQDIPPTGKILSKRCIFAGLWHSTSPRFKQ